MWCKAAALFRGAFECVKPPDFALTLPEIALPERTKVPGPFFGRG